MTEKYMIDIGEKGSEGLDKLDYLFNQTTQSFLLNAGLKIGMHVLDIGCGSGVMTRWMADQVGEKGLVIGIENNENQLNVAKKLSEGRKLKNIKFELCSAYELDTLKQQFDFVYCRFVLHHLHDPVKAIDQIHNALKPSGIYAAEEGIVNFAFSYPYTEAWGSEGARLAPIWTDVPPDNRDPNVGIKMVTKMKRAGFKVTSANIVHPLMVTQEEKSCLLTGIDEMKDFYLSEGHAESDWENNVKATKALVEDDEQIAGFYASCQVAGVK